MRLVLDPAEEAVHGEWLRQTPGAYEWWYFDALSDDGDWALTCIWFLGNPFSPYYRRAAQGVSASPFAHNAVFFALYFRGRLHAYHFTRVSESQLHCSETTPLRLHFGPNHLVQSQECWTLTLADTNANGRRLDAVLMFHAPSLVGKEFLGEEPPRTAYDSDHVWLPIAPACQVKGQILLQEPSNTGVETVSFSGAGYHDHNWGRLPFDTAIRDWYWARAELPGGRAVLLYHVRPHRGKAVSHLLLFEGGRLLVHDAAAHVSLSRPVFNGFGTRYAAELRAEGGGLRVAFRFGARLDSSPFYIRTFCAATLGSGAVIETGQGIGEYLRPKLLSWAVVASATKARIVEARPVEARTAES